MYIPRIEVVYGKDEYGFQVAGIINEIYYNNWIPVFPLRNIIKKTLRSGG